MCEGFCGPTEGDGLHVAGRLLLSANLIPKRQLMGTASKIVSFVPSVLAPRCTKMVLGTGYWRYLYSTIMPTEPTSVKVSLSSFWG